MGQQHVSAKTQDPHLKYIPQISGKTQEAERAMVPKYYIVLVREDARRDYIANALHQKVARAVFRRGRLQLHSLAVSRQTATRQF